MAPTWEVFLLWILLWASVPLVYVTWGLAWFFRAISVQLLAPLNWHEKLSDWIKKNS